VRSGGPERGREPVENACATVPEHLSSCLMSAGLSMLVLGAAPPSFAAVGVDDSSILRILLALTIILLGARFGGHLAVRIGQPAVLGEIIVGVALGNLEIAGFHGIQWIQADPVLEILAQLGVILLLFEVGLESTVREMARVGASSFLVAVLGVVTPFTLGWLVGAWILPHHSWYAHMFIGATLTATSVGITARVLQDLGKSKSNEARVILGAAVIDDVLGLVILSVVTGIIDAANHGGSVSIGRIVWVFSKSAIFLAAALGIGTFLSPRIFAFAARIRGRGVLLTTSLAFCFILAAVAGRIGLAPIVGAYAAGLILENVHYRRFRGRDGQLEDLLRPLTSFLAPVFFVIMGMRVGLGSFSDPAILGLAGLLTVAAIAGKQVCSLGAIGPGLDRISIGIGMVPRGEVGLIFANIGLGLVLFGERIIDQGTYSAIVIMVIVTTMVTPPALKWSLNRSVKP
jgi:Kef-type K+ transport system membrane component KefB